MNLGKFVKALKKMNIVNVLLLLVCIILVVLYLRLNSKEKFDSTTSPTGGTTSPTGGTPSPTGGTPSPTGGTTSPTGGTPSPTGGTPSPTGGASVVVGDVSSTLSQNKKQPIAFNIPKWLTKLNIVNKFGGSVPCDNVSEYPQVFNCRTNFGLPNNKSCPANNDQSWRDIKGNTCNILNSKYCDMFGDTKVIGEKSANESCASCCD